MKVCIFMDYDNLLEKHKTEGFVDLAFNALSLAGIDGEATRADCDLRVYGGWYEGNALTPLAQRVAADLQSVFPCVIQCISKVGTPVSVKVVGSIACSLMQDPKLHMINTFRTRGAPTNLKISKPEEIGCSLSECIFPDVRKMFKKKRCPVSGCNKRLHDIITRREQKIVDTMLTCDLIYASTFGYDYIIVISSDDDFLPSIRTACLQNSRVVRLHTKPFDQRNLQTQSWPNLTEQEL